MSFADALLAESRAKIISLMSDKSERERKRDALLEEQNRLSQAQAHIKQVLGGGQGQDEDDEMEDVDASAFTRQKSNASNAGTPSKIATPGETATPARTVGTPVKSAVTRAKRTPIKQEGSISQRTPSE